MRILIISYDNEFINGEEIYVTQLIKALKEKGHNLYHIFLTKRNLINYNNYDKNTICQTKFINISDNNRNKFSLLFSNNLIDFKLYFKLRRCITNFNPDVIHINNVGSFKTIILSSRGFPKVQTIHELTSIFPLYLRFFNINNKDLDNHKISLKSAKILGLKYRTILFDYLIFGNSWVKKGSIRYFLCPSQYLTHMCKINGFKNSIYLPHFQDISNKDSMNSIKDENYILFVGRLDKVKGVDYLLKAFKIVHEQNKYLKLIVIGDGPERGNLEDLAILLKIDKFVKFLGNVNNLDIGAYYKRSKLVVIPSIYPETGPLVALEAMNFSKPIIAFGVGGLLDFVENGFNGFLVKRFDINSFAAKILTLSKDKRLSVNMGKNGRKMLEEKWSKDKHLDRLINIYKSVILNIGVIK